MFMRSSFSNTEQLIQNLTEFYAQFWLDEIVSTQAS